MSGPISRIRVPATFFLSGERRDETADFTLGPGPCGKTVTALRFSTEVHPGYLTVDQTTEDKETKVFLYRVADLLGRVEVTYS